MTPAGQHQPPMPWLGLDPGRFVGRQFAPSAELAQVIGSHFGTGRFSPTSPDARRASTGLAVLSDASLAETRVYICDPDRHCVQIVDGSGRPLAVFGQHGTRPGEFVSPSDVTLICVNCEGEAIDEGSLDTTLVAVADSGNDRIQLFETDGLPVGIVGGSSARAAEEACGLTAPWVKLDSMVATPSPWRVSAIGRLLTVHCADRVVTIDLSNTHLFERTMWSDAAVLIANRPAATWLN